MKPLRVEAGLAVETASNMTRSTPPPADLSAAAVRATFDGPTGYIAIADGPADAGSKIVLEVTQAVVPPFNPNAGNLAQAKRQISNQIANDYLQQFIVEKQRQLGVAVNQTSLQTIIGGQPAGQSGGRPAHRGMF